MKKWFAALLLIVLCAGVCMSAHAHQHKFTETAGVWTCTCGTKAVVDVDGAKYADFDSTVSDWGRSTADSKLTLLDDVSASTESIIKGTKTLDLNGHTLSSRGTVFWADDESTFTIMDSGTDGTIHVTTSTGIKLTNGSTLIFTGGTLYNDIRFNDAVGIHCQYGNLNVYGGTISVPYGTCFSLTTSTATIGNNPTFICHPTDSNLPVFSYYSGRLVIQSGTSIPDDGWSIRNKGSDTLQVQGLLNLPNGYKLIDAENEPVYDLYSRSLAYIKRVPFTVAVSATEGGTVTGGNTYYSGENATVTATPDTGYEFVSWTEDGSVVSTDAAYTFTVSSDRTLVASFKRLRYLITFVNDDGTELDSHYTFHGNTPRYVADDLPQKQSDLQYTYKFDGWKPSIVPATGEATYTATYTATPIPYTVRYDANGGTGTMAPQMLYYGAADQYLTQNAFAREGYTFGGWNTAADGSGTSYADRAAISAAFNGTLYAQWQIIPDPVITSPTTEQTVTVYEGEQATLSVTAENTVSYQWYIDYNDGAGWQAIGTNSNAYVSNPTALSNDGYRYKCAVTGENNKTIESVIFTLKVLEKPLVPETGDNAHIGLWLAMGLLSCAGMLMIRMQGKKRSVH